jgi:HK97 family phage major capsid protein
LFKKPKYERIIPMLEKLRKIAEDLIAVIEAAGPEEDMAAQEAELEKTMRKIESISKAQAARDRLPKAATASADESTHSIEFKPTNKAIDEASVFCKAWKGEVISDSEKDLVKIKGSAIAMPRIMKALLFGPTVASAMGWLDSDVSKAINPFDASGASLIPRDYDRELSKIEGENIYLMDKCRIKPAPHGNLYVPRLDRASSPSEHGIAVQWLQTGSTKPETEPKFEQIAITCHEVAGYVEIYDRMLTRSMIDLMSELAGMFRGSLKHAIDIAIVNGLGNAANQPVGIIGYAGIGDSVREVLNEVSYNDLVNVKHSTNPRARQGSMYLINNEVEAALEGTLAVDGRPLFGASVANGPYDRLCGFPFLSNVEISPDLGAEGDVLFLNPRFYTLALEQDVSIVSDGGLGLGFRTNRTNLKAFASVGGSPIEPDAFAVLLATT